MTVNLESIDIDDVGVVVVDAQNAFASESSPLADRGADMARMSETVPQLRQLVSTARNTVIPIAFTRSVRRADEKDAPRNVYDILPEVYGEGDPICCAGAPETAFLDSIEPRDSDYTVKKRRYDAFTGTDLDRYLRAESVSTVLIAGFATNVCVESTARSAHEHGYGVLLVEDCCNAFDERAHEAAVDNIQTYFGASITLEDVKRLLST